MRSRRRTLLGLIALVLVALLLMADDCSGGNAQQVQRSEQQQNADQRAKLEKIYAYPQTTDSSELRNLHDYYTRFADPNAVNYVYVVTPAGQVLFEYQVVGKCTSTESVYSAPESVIDNNAGAAVTVPAPQPDGSYGANGNGLICEINDAARTMFILYQGSNTLLFSQKPLGLTTQPIISVVPNGK